jgi:hypothetical protein
MLLDVGAQGEIQVHGLLHPTIQQSQPVCRGFFQIDCTQQIACLHNDFQRIAQIMCQSAHLDCNVFGDFLADTWDRRIYGVLFSHVGKDRTFSIY